MTTELPVAAVSSGDAGGADAGAGGGGVAWSLARGVMSLAVPVFPGEPRPFGPRPVSEVAMNLAVSTGLCCAAGYCLTRRSSLLLRVASRFTPSLRDEVWEEGVVPASSGGGGGGDEASSAASSSAAANGGRASTAVSPQDGDAEAGTKPARRMPPKRNAPELLFIMVHNSTVAFMALVAWFLGSPELALFAFNLEVAYEIYDTLSLGLKRLEPETLIHHVVSPICILCSTQTDVDFRVLCHLCFCIDISGAILGYSKFLLRFAHLSSVQIYRNLVVVYGLLRVLFPFIDTAIIVQKTIASRGGFFSMVTLVKVTAEGSHSPVILARTDWTQLYFWAIAVLDAFNLYFFCVIRGRARMSPQLVAHLERVGCY